jgi:hypothetical protein
MSMVDASEVVVAELVVPEGDSDLLAEIVSELAADDGVVFGPQRTVNLDTQLYFDPATAVMAVKAMTAVISGVGAATKVVNSLIRVAGKSPKTKIAVTVGASRVVVSGNDPRELRAALRAALKLV